MADVFDAKNTWVGIGAKFGGQLIAGGIESVTGAIFNLENPAHWSFFTIETARLGPGLGGALGSATIVVVLDCRSVMAISGTEMTDWGFNAAFGARLDSLLKLLKGAKQLDALWPIARQALPAIRRLRVGAGTATRGANAALQGFGITADQFDKIKTATNYVWNAKTTLSRDGKPYILTLDVPATGYGLELSLVYTSGRFSII
jgi:hypothetical protein